MRLVPEDKNGKVVFYQSRVSAWIEHAAEIGLDPGELSLMQADIDEAQAKLTAHFEMQIAARAATIGMNEAIETMCTRGARLIAMIRGTAGINGGPVYQLSHLPPPKTPSIMGPPGDPAEFKSSIDQIGWLTLRWKCKNPRGSCGTMYQLRRQLNGEGPFEHLDMVGKKVFIDRGVPLGAKMAVYEVKSIRTTRSGKATRHSVYFGSLLSEKQTQEMYGPRQAA